jgi:catechol 2,3-dioxygenase-like lactoylglutathione lyase family enzyme
MKINHIGIIVSNPRNNIEIYRKIGYCKSRIVIDKIQNNKIVIMKHCNSPDIELIYPLNESSSIYNFKKGYHHICYEAEPGEDIIQKFEEMKIGKIFTPPIMAPALNNRKVVFACLQNGTFIELIL